MYFNIKDIGDFGFVITIKFKNKKKKKKKKRIKKNHDE